MSGRGIDAGAEERKVARFRALNPARSVVVEACAGSGKTWLLVSRLIRAMLAGARPGDILAITYTRKAAREIEARLRAMLADFATQPDASVQKALLERGIPAEKLPQMLPRARALFEEVLRADPPMTVTTFHGWFARLISGAPMESGLAGRGLEEAASALVDEAWAMLSARCGRDPEGEVASVLLHLYESIGAYGVRRLMSSFIDRRAEWRVWRDRCGGLNEACEAARALFGVDRPDSQEAFPSASIRGDIEAFARMATSNGATGAKLSASLISALDCEEPEARFEMIRAAFLTGTNQPRSFKPVKEFIKAHGSDVADRMMRLFDELAERVESVLLAHRDRALGELNERVFVLGEALLEEYEKLKQQRRVMDFADLECEVDRLLSEQGSGSFLQARLDARYRHILLDEFQDTNPLQWRILRSWLDSYGADQDRPRIFLVGDPKQSIYRFRRAEPRLFDAATRYFQSEAGFNAECISNAHTFRNAGGVVGLVNQVFGETAPMAGFVVQTAERDVWQARIEVLPLIQSAPADAVTAVQLRNPLITPREEIEDKRRAEEAAQLAHRVKEMVGTWQVTTKEGALRPANYGDVMILTRRTTYLAAYEQALRTAGIPFVSPGRGGLLDTLEARDLLAVLRFLADQKDDLALGHVLRSPLFQCSDDVLLQLSVNSGERWWSRLRSLAKEGYADLQRVSELLQAWREAARKLPAHDLIDHMFHTGQWMERYQAVAPAALWPGVHANLESLLELALNVDAGRYPSLTRFIDELARMAKSDDEAPDEGLIRTNSCDQGRVRIMTIHGSKGLEAPIVWMIDAHVAPRNAEGYQIAMDWPVEAMQPAQFSVLGSLGQTGLVHKKLLEQEALAAEREELNLLYVAVTRAEQVFIVSGVEPTRTLNVPTAYSRLADAVNVLAAGEAVLGSMPEGARKENPVHTEVSSVSALTKFPVGRRHMFAKPTEGQQFGVKLHAWLEAATEGVPLPRVPVEVEMLGKRLLGKPELKRFFDKACYVAAGNETSFIGHDGKVGRIDRWVDCGDLIWVLDYKSGSVPEDELLADYRQQVGHYCEVLRRIHPGRAVKGLLLFTDETEIEVS